MVPSAGLVAGTLTPSRDSARARNKFMITQNLKWCIPSQCLVGKIMNEPISTFCLKDSRRSDKWRLRPFCIERIAQAETEHKKWSAEPLWFYLVLKCWTLKRQGTRQGTGKVFCPRSEEKKWSFSENLGWFFFLWPSTEKCIAKNPKPDNQNKQQNPREVL